MNIYKQKLNKTLTIISVVLLAICLLAIYFCITSIINARITVDYVSNSFLICINSIIIFALVDFLLFSNYKLTDKCIVIKTAFFKDPINYDLIKKIYYYATEDELYIELLKNSENIIKVNLSNKDINLFANELKKHIPLIPYEVSLPMDSDIE